MNRSLYKTLAALLWLAPFAICVRYRQVWDLLPQRVATHFNADGVANGWMTREVSLYFSAGFLAFIAAVFFVVLLVVEKRYSLAKLSWALLVFFHVEIWMLVYLQNSLLAYNLNHAQIAIAPLPIVTVAGVIAIVWIAIAEKRGAPLSHSEIIAEEAHSGKRLALVLLIPAVVLIPAALLIPGATQRVAMTTIALVLLGAFAMAWDGFHYYFSRHGVEIRTLGFRLKSIPLLQIKNYAIENWSPLRGYGIRGVGNHKAYVWGKTGVRVEMFDGEIFLGHGDPQRIVHDLNVIQQYRNS
jgi:hypothetical protein